MYRVFLRRALSHTIQSHAFSDTCILRRIQSRAHALAATKLHVYTSSRLNTERIRLARGVPGIESLGARSFDDFFRAAGAPGFERAKAIAAQEGLEVLRYPLPGTPEQRNVLVGLDDPHEKGAIGRLSSRPMGAGTGFVILRRYTRASLRERWRSRFTHPRSTSLAEREWNLMCRAREHGVATPEPLAVGRGEGAVFAERSFLVVRELDDMLSLRQWADASLDPRLREHIRDALVLALERLWSAGVWLPNVKADNILVGSPRNPDGGDPNCVARKIVELQAGRLEPIESLAAGALRWGDLPEVAFTEFRGGSMPARISSRRRNTLLRAFSRELEGLQFPCGPSTE